jgi:hypothetical protein
MDEASIIAPSEAQGDPNDPYAARLEQRQAAGEDVTSISLGERFKRAARAAYEDSLTGRARQLSDVVGGVQNVDEFGIPVGPAPDPADIRRSIEDRRMAAALWESTPVFGNPLEAGSSLVGGLFGGGISPENWVTRIPGLTSVIERIAPNVAGRVAAAGATQAAVAGASDVVGQAVEIAAGERSDLSGKEAALRAALGFGVGSILHGAGEAVSAVAPKKTPKVIQEEVGAAVEAERQVVVTEAVHHAAVQDEMAALAVEDPSLASAPPSIASGPPAAAASPSFVETRGQGIQYHGTSSSDLSPTASHYATLNYYGQGFYTTDAVDVAHGYSRRGSRATGERSLYSVEEARPLNIYDAEKPIDPELLKRITPDESDPHFSTLDDVVAAALSEEPKNLREFYDHVRDIGTNDGLSADTIQEAFDGLNDNLQQLGYDGISHLGGLRTKAKEHRVIIYFNPEKDLRVNKSAFDRFQQAPADAIQFRKRPADQPEQPSAASTGTPTDAPILTFQEQSARLAQDLDLTLRQGRLKGGKDAIGQYDPSQDVARVQKITDIRTVAHEAAHGLEGDVSELPALLDKHKAELGPLDYQVGRDNHREGFAEYLRLFVENPAAAAKAAPQFATEFQDLMQRDAPQALKAFQDARDAYANYLNAPSGAKLDAIMKRSEPDGIWKDLEQHGLPRTVSLYISRFYGTMLDEKNPVAQSVRAIAREWRDASGARPSIEGADNPETLARSFSRAAQAGISDMRDGVRPYHGTVPEGPSLRDAMIKATGDPGIFGRWNDERMKAFDDYLAARRAEVLWERYDAGDLPNRPVALTKADVASALAELDAAYPSFRDASQMVHDYTRQILRKARDGGLITADLFDELSKEKFYVPLMRDMRDQTQVVGRGAGRDPGQTDLIRRLQGSDRDIISPVQSLMTQTFLVNRTLAHNDIIKALVGLSRSARAAGARNVGRILEEIPAHEIVGKEVNVQEVVKNAAKKAGINDTDTQVLVGAISNTFGP